MSGPGQASRDDSRMSGPPINVTSDDHFFADGLCESALVARVMYG
jgi:hypothetical protein